MNKNSKVLALKYRPKTFEDLIGQEIVADTILNSIPSQSTVHLSNSTSARYVQLIDCPKSLKFHCNRGVAGIDGCTSTAVADAEVSREHVILISGDIAFMYDINGLALTERIPSNFNVIVINNGGGEIFRWLDGPESIGLVDKYFETKPRILHYSIYFLQSI